MVGSGARLILIICCRLLRPNCKKLNSKLLKPIHRRKLPIKTCWLISFPGVIHTGRAFCERQTSFIRRLFPAKIMAICWLAAVTFLCWRSFAAFIRGKRTPAILPTTKFLRSYFFNSSNVKENEGTKCFIKYATSGRAAYFSILAAAAAKATSNSWLPLCNSSAHFR